MKTEPWNRIQFWTPSKELIGPNGVSRLTSHIVAMVTVREFGDLSLNTLMPDCVSLKEIENQVEHLKADLDQILTQARKHYADK